MHNLQQTLDKNMIELSHNKTNVKAWIVCFSAALFFFYEFIQMNMFNAIAQGVTQAFQLDAEHFGHLSAAYYLSTVICLLPAGVILDRFSTKKIILITMGFTILGTLFFALASNYWFAYSCRFFAGIGSAFCFLGPIRLASRWFPNNRLALVTGLIVTMGMAGGVFAQTPLTLLTEVVGWRHALIIDATFGLVFWLLILAFVENFPAAEQKSLNHATLHHIGFFKSLRSSYFKLQNWLGAIYTMLLNVPVGVLGAAWGSYYLTQVHHLTMLQASYVTSMIFMGTIVGGPCVGWLSDYVQRRKIPMIIGALLAIITIVLILNIPHPGLFTLMSLFFFLGVVTSFQVLSYPTITESNPIALTATSVSIISISTQASSYFLQPLFGKIIQHNWSGTYINNIPFYSTENYYHAMLLIPAGFIIGLIAIFFIRETYCQQYQAVRK